MHAMLLHGVDEGIVLQRGSKESCPGLSFIAYLPETIRARFLDWEDALMHLPWRVQD